MQKTIIFFYTLLFCLSAYADEDARKEFLSTINSNLDFYNKIEPGMGFKGEAFSRLVDENGKYLNCTIALRGKQIVLNSTLDSAKIYFYETHWVDINVEGSTDCDPSHYDTTPTAFVSSEIKRTAQSVLILISKADVNVERISNKIYQVKYLVPKGDDSEEFEVDAIYNLNFPLFMSPDVNGFVHQYFKYKEIDLSSIDLCPSIDDGGECVKNQDLTYLIH